MSEIPGQLRKSANASCERARLPPKRRLVAALDCAGGPVCPELRRRRKPPGNTKRPPVCLPGGLHSRNVPLRVGETGLAGEG